MYLQIRSCHCLRTTRVIQLQGKAFSISDSQTLITRNITEFQKNLNMRTVIIQQAVQSQNDMKMCLWSLSLCKRCESLIRTHKFSRLHTCSTHQYYKTRMENRCDVNIWGVETLSTRVRSYIHNCTGIHIRKIIMQDNHHTHAWRNHIRFMLEVHL